MLVHHPPWTLIPNLLAILGGFFETLKPGSNIKLKDRGESTYTDGYIKHFHKERIVTTGLLPDATLPVITNNESNNDISSFIIPRYLTDGHIDNVQLNVKDSTMKQCKKIITTSYDNKNQTSIDSYMLSNVRE